MTNEFAIKVLTELKGYGDKFANIGFDRKEALDMAIKALEQQQDKVIHNHPCEDCYYNDGDVHAECVVCDIPVEKVTKAFINDVESVKDQLDGQPCEDAVSREEAIRIAEQGQIQGFEWQIRKLCTLPSVTPKFTDEEIQKMQELEQAQLEKAYELGMQTSFEDWLNSFNTDSATECFTAVQQLKEKTKEG